MQISTNAWWILHLIKCIFKFVYMVWIVLYYRELLYNIGIQYSKRKSLIVMQWKLFLYYGPFVRGMHP